MVGVALLPFVLSEMGVSPGPLGDVVGGSAAALPPPLALEDRNLPANGVGVVSSCGCLRLLFTLSLVPPLLPLIPVLCLLLSLCCVRVDVRAVDACSLVGHVLLYADLCVTHKIRTSLVLLLVTDPGKVVVLKVCLSDPADP